MPAVDAEKKVYSFSANLPVVEKVPADSIHILDVGCGSGQNGSAIKQVNPLRRVTGVSLSREEAELARTVLDDVVVADVEKWTPPDSMLPFDCIFLSHVLE